MNIEDWQSQIWDCPNMNPTAVAIALAVGSHGHWSKDQTVWPSRQRISAMVGTSRDNVNKYLTALEEQGWLKVVQIRKDNVREYELCKPQVAVVYGILAAKARGKSVNQVAVSYDNLDEPESEQVVVVPDEVVVDYDKQVAVVNEEVVVNYDTNLLRTYQENLPKELSKTDSTVSDEPVPLTDEPLEEVAVFKRLDQVESYIEGVRYLSLTREQKDQIRELCLNPKWLGTESRPNYRTQAAIKEVLG